METVLGGQSMAAPSQTLALPWYARSDYPALLNLFSDPNKLPTTYDAWLERAEGVEQIFQSAGFDVARIWIGPIPFAAWCKERNVSPNQVARLNFVNEAVQDRLTLPSDTETLALHLVSTLHDSTDELPQQWRMLEELEAPTMDAIMYAITRGWVIVEAGNSICLTAAGRRLMKSR
jgi:hypothetical protein